MTAPATPAAIPWRHPLWILAGFTWLWLIWACAGEWIRSEDYNFGFFVPPLAAYFLWKRIEAGRTAAFPGSGPLNIAAWLIIAISILLMLPLELVRQTPIHWRPTLWSIGFIAFGNTLAAAWLTGGWTRVRLVAFPAGFLLLGIPWPTFAENAIAFPLMQLVTQWSVGLIHLLGHPATAAGSTITLPNCTVGVEEACSGLRSLQTALMVGVAAGELARLSGWARAVLLAFAFLMAVAGNQVRVLMLVMAGIRGGNEAVAGIHDLAGNTVLGILLVGVGSAAWALAKLQRSAPARSPSAEESPAPAPSCPAGWWALGAACAALFLAHAWFFVRGGLAARPVPPILAPSAESGFAVDHDVPAAILGILQPDEFSYIRQPAEGGSKRTIGYHFYWEPRKGNANQLYHRPDRCMPGAGWRIDGEVTRETFNLGGREFTFNVFPFRSPGGHALMLWGSFLNGEPAEIEFNSDVYLPTANLLQFIRTGTRLYSFEVAACIMPYTDGAKPTRAEIEAYANKVFRPSELPSSDG